MFNASEILLAKQYLLKIELDLQQSFLDETAAQIKQRRKTNNPIRNPIGYLAWLCGEHGKGNTFLTSAYLNYQSQRERKLKREQDVSQKQQAMTQAAIQGEDIRPFVAKNENTHRQVRHRAAPKLKGGEFDNDNSTRWEGINVALKPRQVGGDE